MHINEPSHPLGEECTEQGRRCSGAVRSWTEGLLLTTRRRGRSDRKEAEAETTHSNEDAALSSELEGHASWGGRGLPRPLRSETPVPTAKPGRARAVVGGQCGLARGSACTPGDQEAVARDAPSRSGARSSGQAICRKRRQVARPRDPSVFKIPGTRSSEPIPHTAVRGKEAAWTPERRKDGGRASPALSVGLGLLTGARRRRQAGSDPQAWPLMPSGLRFGKKVALREIPIPGAYYI